MEELLIIADHTIILLAWENKIILLIVGQLSCAHTYLCF